MKDISVPKKVLVTGGVRGIGYAIARMFQNKGYTVFVTYSKDVENAEKVEKEGLIPLRADVSSEEEMQAVFSKMGEIDILVNNAGVSLIKQVQDTTMEEWNKLFSVNVGGVFICSKLATQYMLKKNRGLIVNIASVWGEVGASCESVYASSKSAVIGFTKSLAKELGYSGIRVCSISPGVIATKMHEQYSKEDRALILEDIPLGREGTGEDVASAVAFIEENDYVTGIDLPVNGGFCIM
jgi:3-oxoacyl-[acyl-carrier protein] reductase